MLMLSARSLGASEHEAVRESESQRALFDTIKGPTVERKSGNCTAGVALTYHLLPVCMVSPQVSGESLSIIWS